MTRILHVAVLWVAIAVAAVCQDVPPIEVLGPTAPIAKNQFELITVNNLDEAEFLASTITVSPPKGAIAFRVYGAPAVFFRASEPGKYTVTIGRNAKHIEWRKSLAEAATYAKSVDAPADFVSRLEKLHSDAEVALPTRVGSCVVEVAGAVVVPPTTPTDPPPTPSKVNRVTYVYEKDNNNIPRPVSVGLQRLNADSGGSVIATEFEEDSTVDGTPGGRVPSQYKIALEAARKEGLPALVVQSGDTVVRVVKSPTTTEQVLEAAN